MDQPRDERRVRNRRGAGDQLRQDLITAADRLLADGATHESLSLRAVAREVGIAATSIYLHFPDKMALLLAVYERYFGKLATELREAIGEHERPADQLRAGCLRYLRFAVDNAEAYHVMFTAPINFGKLSRPIEDRERPGAEALAVMAGVLLGCGVEPSGVFTSTLCLWAGLHGLATLRQARPVVVWPDEETLVDTLIAPYTAAPAVG